VRAIDGGSGRGRLTVRQSAVDHRSHRFRLSTGFHAKRHVTRSAVTMCGHASESATDLVET
jgi:hypothetical protein